MENYTLLQLNRYIRRVMALNFADPLWITAELVEARLQDGHCFMDLTHKEETEDRILARASAHLWRSDLQRLRFERGRAVEEVLRAAIPELSPVVPAA